MASSSAAQGPPAEDPVPLPSDYMAFEVASVHSLDEVHAATLCSNRGPRDSWKFAGTLQPQRVARPMRRQRCARQRQRLLRTALKNLREQRQLQAIFDEEVWKFPDLEVEEETQQEGSQAHQQQQQRPGQQHQQEGQQQQQ